MMWIFAILAVAAMAGVAAVAAGYGAPLRPEYGDRPDTGLEFVGDPASVEDLRRVRFPVVLRGYRMADVDALLERLIAQREADAPFRRPEPAASESADDPEPEPAAEPGSEAATEREAEGRKKVPTESAEADPAPESDL